MKTLFEVYWAVAFLEFTKEDGGYVSPVDVVELTGLARSTVYRTLIMLNGMKEISYVAYVGARVTIHPGSRALGGIVAKHVADINFKPYENKYSYGG